MGKLSSLVFIVLVCCWLLPLNAFAGDISDEALLEFAVSAYQDGQLVMYVADQFKPGTIRTIAFACGPDSEPMKSLKFWTSYATGDAPSMADYVKQEFARVGDNVQRITFHGIEMQLYSSAVDWVEIDVRGCSQEDLDKYNAVVNMSPELNRGLFERMLKPVAHIELALNKREPILWPAAMKE